MSIKTITAHVLECDTCPEWAHPERTARTDRRRGGAVSYTAGMHAGDRTNSARIAQDGTECGDPTKTPGKDSEPSVIRTEPEGD